MTADFPAIACEMKTTGKPDAGNLHVRFDEGEQGTPALYSTGPKAFSRMTANFFR